MRCKSSVLRCALVQSTVKGQRDYYKEEKEASAEKVRHQRLIFFLIVTLFCLLTCVAALLVQWRRKVLTLKNDRILDMYEELKSSQLEKDKKNANYISTLKEMRQGYSKLLSTELVNVFELCEKYFSKNTGNKILNLDVTSAQLPDELMKINKCGFSAVELERFINENMAGIMRDFREDCPLPEESDYWLMCLLMIGLNGGVISMIMNLPTKDAVYMRKFRLKETIKSSNSMNKDKYLLVF